MKKLYAIISLIILLSVLVACGPSTTAPVTGTPAYQEEAWAMDIMRFLKYTNSINSAEFIYVDNYYTLVDEEWFKSNVMNGYVDFLSRNGVAFSDKQKNDCDDFSRGFSFFSRVKSMQANFLPSNMAVADVYYKDLNMGHAINLAVVLDKNRNWKLLYIEPQGPKFVKLSDEIKESYIFYVGY